MVTEELVTVKTGQDPPEKVLEKVHGNRLLAFFLLFASSASQVLLPSLVAAGTTQWCQVNSPPGAASLQVGPLVAAGTAQRCLLLPHSALVISLKALFINKWSLA